MATAPRNLRTKTPRPLHIKQQAASQRLRRAYRFGSSVTPPPVAVSVTDEPSELALPELDHPLAQTPLRPALSPWMWFALSALLCALSATAFRHFDGNAWLSRQLHPLQIDVSQPAAAALAKPPAPSASAVATSGWQVQHDGHVPIQGGVLVSPKSFTTRGGDYDLIIHFHGDVAIVKESVAFAGIDAALAVINLGESSRPYRDAFRAPGAYNQLLAQIDAGLKQRGLRAPKLRRVALTSWSAGYGAIESILEHRRAPQAERDALDAIIALDGIHCGFVDGDRKRLNERTVLPFLRAAEAAANGGLMFSMTHSQIDPVGYASTARTAKLLLARVGAQPGADPTLRIPPWVALPAAARALKNDHVRRMLPTHDTHVGQFRVQGFEGRGRDDHAMHLTQMAAIALPDLAKRWQAAAGPRLGAGVDTSDEVDHDDEAADELVDPYGKGAPNHRAAAKKEAPTRRAAAPPAAGAVGAAARTPARTGQTKTPPTQASHTGDEDEVYP